MLGRGLKHTEPENFLILGAGGPGGLGGLGGRGGPEGSDDLVSERVSECVCVCVCVCV